MAKTEIPPSVAPAAADGKGRIAERRPSPRRKRIVWPWLAGAALLCIAYLAWQRSQALPAVTLAETRIVDLSASFTAESYVEGRDYRLAPEISERVTAVSVREGDRVRAGQQILALDSSSVGAGRDQALAAVQAARASESRVRAQYDAFVLQLEPKIAAARAGVEQANKALVRAKAGAREDEISQARHAVEAAHATTDEARRTFERVSALYREGALPRASYDNAQTALDAAQAQERQSQAALDLLRAGPRPEDVAIAQSGVDLAKTQLDVALSGSAELAGLRDAVVAARATVGEAEAALKQAGTAVAKCVLRSPVDGVVTSLSIEAGAFAVAGSPVITVSTRQDLRIEAEVSSEDAGKIRQGMPVTVTSPAYPGRKFSAHIVGILPVGELKPDAAIRTRIIRTRVALESGWELFRPGMEVDVEGTSTVKRALCVPSDALALTGDETVVWVVESGRVLPRPVTVGYANPSWTEILTGLKQGDQVVVKGKEGLGKGGRVQVKP